MVHILAQIFEGTCGPLIDPRLLFKRFKVFFGQSHPQKENKGKCGPLIDPIKGNMWTTYWPYSIYIYVWLQPLLAGTLGSNIHNKKTVFQNAPNRHPPKRWGLSCLGIFVFFSFFVFFPPWFFISPSTSRNRRCVKLGSGPILRVLKVRVWTNLKVRFWTKMISFYIDFRPSCAKFRVWCFGVCNLSSATFVKMAFFWLTSGEKVFFFQKISLNKNKKYVFWKQLTL